MLTLLKYFGKLQLGLLIIAIIFGVWERIVNIESSIAYKTIKHEKQHSDKLFTKNELAKFNGENNTPLYLAILGSIYDVTKGKKHYGSGCAYNFFVGRDASVSFVTGEFEKYDEKSADDVNSMQLSDLLSLDNWKNFYHKDYTYVGKLIGRFYEEDGSPTIYHHKFLALVDQGKKKKLKAEQIRSNYPDCNISWSEEKGTRVWCTNLSGGKQRDWIGYPRKLFEIGDNNFRCACIQKEELDTTDVMIKPYDNCELLSHECYYKVDES